MTGASEVRAAAFAASAAGLSVSADQELLLAVEAVFSAFERAEIIEGDDLGACAIELAAGGWPVLPLRGKVPAIAKLDGGNGVHDGTTDLAQVRAWWGGRYSRCNIGARVPDALVLIDVDPRKGGDDTLEALEREHGPLPPTLSVLTGGPDHGRHRYYLRPAGKLRGTLGTGIDIKAAGGYGVMPPSVHPDTGRPYRWLDPSAAVAEPPAWVVALLSPPEPPAPVPRSDPRRFDGDSIADRYSAEASWRGLLEPEGWRLVAGDGDSDGSRWRHPTATATWSATVKHSCLFVYSPNTAFPVTTASDPHGITRFRALGILAFDGDLSAAARSLRLGAP